MTTANEPVERVGSMVRRSDMEYCSFFVRKLMNFF